MARRRTLNDDRYELEPLASGGMGEVWVGRDTRLDREVAVKFLRTDAAGDEATRRELTRRFVRESRITARLQHPGVPAVYDAGTDRGALYMVMQRVRGTTLSDLLAEHDRLPVGWAAAVAAQVCSVLAAAHQASLVHRDLKPANLMLEADGTVKVLDFGLAVGVDLAGMSRITLTGHPVGTPAYMAPEQILGGTTGPQTDLYALGCTLYEMLTGRLVFDGVTSYSVMQQQVNDVPPVVRAERPEVPAGLNDLVSALLAKQPEDRPESAEAACELLLPYVGAAAPLPGAVHSSELRTPVRMYAAVLTGALNRRADSEPAPALAPAPLNAPRNAPTAGETGPGRPKAMARPGSSATPRQPTASPPPGPVTNRPRPGTGDGSSAAGAEPKVVSRADLSEARYEAGTLLDADRFQEAAELLGDVAGRAAERFGRTDPDVLNARLEWANVLFEGGDYRAALPVYQDLLPDLAEHEGPDSELVFQCRLQLATCHASLGETAVALDLGEHLLADVRRGATRRDPRPYELRLQIGLWQLGAARHEDARTTLRELLDDVNRTLGTEHPMVAKVRQVLATVQATSAP